MKRKGMTLEVTSSGALAKSLDACVVSRLYFLLGSVNGVQDPANPEFNTLVRIMATRCMLSAEYFCSGSVSKDSFGHYGLATSIYTHFTASPDYRVLRQLTVPSLPSDGTRMYLRIAS